MGNSTFKQIEEGLSSENQEKCRASCLAFQSFVASNQTPDWDWPWVVHLLADTLQKQVKVFDSIVYTEDFHGAVRALRLLSCKVVRKESFQGVLCQSLTVHLITGVFTASNAAQASLFLGTLEALLGTPAGEEEEEGPDACGAERDSRTAERCGVYLGPWKRLLRSLVMSEREWLETEKALASSQAGGRQGYGPPRPPAPLTLLRGPTQAYQSAECLGFGLFLFHCFLTRDPAGPECPVILGVLRDYMMCCTEEAVARSSEAVLTFPGSSHPCLPTATSQYAKRIAYLLYDIALSTLRCVDAVPSCRQSLACLPYFAPVFPEPRKLLALLDACLPHCGQAMGPDGAVRSNEFDHELHFSLRAFRSHVLVYHLPAEDWWHAVVTLCAVFVTFRAHLSAEHFAGDCVPLPSFLESSVPRGKTVSVADSASGTPGPSQEAGSPRSSVSTASSFSGGQPTWARLVAVALRCLQVLLLQPAAEQRPAHRLLAGRLVAFLFVHSREEFEPLLVDCLHILATKWADVPDTLSHAVMDELLHSLTLGALLRYGCSGGVPLRGGGPHMLDLLRDDLKLTPLPVEPRAAFPDFEGQEVLDLEATPQLSLASWLLSHPAVGPFAKTVVGHRAQLFGHLLPEEEEEAEDASPAKPLAESQSAPAELLHFDGFSADFRITGWNTAVFSAAANALLADPAPCPQDYDAGARLCERLGHFAFTHFQWQGQLPGCILDRYHVRADGVCAVVLPAAMLQHPVQYQPLLAQASAVLSHTVQHLIHRLSTLLCVLRGAPSSLQVVNRRFRQFASSHVMCYIHREVLYRLMEGPWQGPAVARMEPGVLRQRLRSVTEDL